MIDALGEFLQAALTTILRSMWHLAGHSQSWTLYRHGGRHFPEAGALCVYQAAEGRPQRQHHADRCAGFAGADRHGWPGHRGCQLVSGSTRGCGIPEIPRPIAAATNGTSSYSCEAMAVTAQFGSKRGRQCCRDHDQHRQLPERIVKLLQSLDPETGAAASCSQIVGFRGSTQSANNGPYLQSLISHALAQGVSAPRTYCVLALARTTRRQACAPMVHPLPMRPGCNVMSNTDATCNGHNLLATDGNSKTAPTMDVA